jgi:hypothetical protein
VTELATLILMGVGVWFALDFALMLLVVLIIVRWLRQGSSQELRGGRRDVS